MKPKTGRLCSLILIAASLTWLPGTGYASWSTYGANYSRTFSIEEDIAPPLSLAWKQELSQRGTIEMEGSPPPIWLGNPVSGFGKLFVPFGEEIIAFETSDGKQTWSTKVTTRITGGSGGKPVVALTTAKTVVTSEIVPIKIKEGQFAMQQDILGLDQQTGEEVWRLEKAPSFFVLEDKVLVPLHNGSVSVLDAATGKKLGDLQTRVKVGALSAALLRPESEPERKATLFLRGGDWIGCFISPYYNDPEGLVGYNFGPIWEQILSLRSLEPEEFKSDIFPNLSGGTFSPYALYLLSDITDPNFIEKETVYAIGLSSKLLWRRTARSLGVKRIPRLDSYLSWNLAYAKDRLYVAAIRFVRTYLGEKNKSFLVCLSAKTGELMWRQEGFAANRLVVLGNYVYAQNANEVYIYDATTGTFLAKSQAMGGAFIISDGQFVYTGRVTGENGKRGEEAKVSLELSAWKPVK